MRLSNLGIAVLFAGSLTQSAGAAAPSKSGEPPSVGAGFTPRVHQATTWGQVTGLTGWRAIWDDDTGVPLQLWGDSPVIGGAVADPAVAEQAARQFLAAHLATLAPGASPSDFELAANELSRNGDVRSVGFIQRANGMRVLGGAIGFSFKRDRLILISSTALPYVSVARPVQRMSASKAATHAAEWLRAAGRRATTSMTQAFAPSEPVIVPIVRERTAAGIDVRYRVAEQVVVDAADGPDSWDVWIDANDGSPILRTNRIHYASGTVNYLVPDRFPGNGRVPRPSAYATHLVNGSATTATSGGMVSWAGTANASVSPGLKGPYAVLTNEVGELVSQTLTLAPGGSVVWDQSGNELTEAQLAAFTSTNFVKQFVKDNIAPNLAWLDQPISVTVNEAGSCNAYNAVDGIHFLRRGGCENTALLADVVYHEFGHALHRASIIPGVGRFDGAISEGLSDMLSALISKDHKLAPGWQMTPAPLRDLDPPNKEKRWPEDATGEVHDDGEIVAGTLWDLWKSLEATRGTDAAYELMLDYYYAIIQRSTSMMSAYNEVLVADDDDGNLTNGTPNACAISAAFDRHGLADPSHSLKLELSRNELAISLKSTLGAMAPCQRSVQSAVVEWKVKGGQGGTVELAATGATEHAGEIPFQPDGTSIQYTVKVTLSDGEVRQFPSNPADPYYELYIGAVKPLWCSGFEAGLGGMVAGPGWELGLPLGVAGDPKAAASGSMVLGTDLSLDGAYKESETAYAETPEIDLAGNTRVRLQFKRWLTVQDANSDQAKILADGTELWVNRNATAGDGMAIDHLDREWVFRDLDLSGQAQDGKVKVRFELAADDGVNFFGGWNIDDVCVVAMTGPAVTCGNGVIDEAETCDDGNRLAGDGCNPNCAEEPEEPGDGGGCAAGGPAGLMGALFALVGLLRPRRRR